MQFYIVMSSSVDPQRLHRTWTALVDHLTVRKVDDFIVSSVNDENDRRNARHFINATNMPPDSVKLLQTIGIFI